MIRARSTLVALAVALVVAGLLTLALSPPEHTGVEHTAFWTTTPVLVWVWPGLLGFGGGAVLILGARFLGRWLRRPQSYWEERDDA